MRLICLTANKKTFRSVHFKPSGVNLILGKQKEPGIADRTRTYNGVGKSLIVALIHFCLGGSENSGLEKGLPGWEFEVRFILDEMVHSARRMTSKQKVIYFDDEEMTLDSFNRMMEEICFRISSRTPFLTFRALIPRFIRPKKESYVSFDTIYKEEKPYQKMLVNSFLLGIDVDLAVRKYELKKRLEDISGKKRSIEADPDLKDFFGEKGDLEIELKDLEERIEKLAAELSDFRVAENYYKIEQGANYIADILQDLKNRAVIIANAIGNIDRSLALRSDIPVDEVEALYEEAGAVWPSSIKKRVEEVTEFHKRLVRNRETRLTAERARFRGQLSELRSRIAGESRILDDHVQYLGTHGALDQFVALTNRLGDLRAQAQQVRQKRDLLESFTYKIQDIKHELVEENARTIEYLKNNQALLEYNLKTFRSYSREFYPDRSGGIVVDNNEKDNQLRFNLNVRLQDDKSDGINEAKIFCYDMTIMTAHHNHKVDFLFHDSRLFSNIDHRQRAVLFRVAHETTKDCGLQYIASVNEDQLTTIRDQFTEQEFASIISDNIIMELTDESQESKLLGIQVELSY